MLTISICFILVFGAIYPIFETNSSGSNGMIIFFQQAHADRSGQPGSNGKFDLTSQANGGNGGNRNLDNNNLDSLVVRKMATVAMVD